MFIFLLCIILFSSCDKSPVPDTFDRPSTSIEFEQNDEEIAGIAENARRALPIFFRNLARPEKGAGNFCVQYPLTVDDNSMEYVWLGGIRLKDGIYYGVLANTTSLLNMKKGDTITFNPDAITDWMYVQDGKIIGGRSIKYLLEKIPETDRSESQRKILQMF
jgi:uncharacterized protein YegJ (DUF2314 family)